MGGWESRGVRYFEDGNRIDLTCFQLAKLGYGLLEEGFEINEFNELFCDGLVMYGFNGQLDFTDKFNKKIYHCDVVKGVVNIKLISDIE